MPDSSRAPTSRAAPILAAAASAVAALVALAWVTGHPLWRTWIPGESQTGLLTAAGLVAGAAGVWFACAFGRAERWRGLYALGMVLGGMAMLAAMLASVVFPLLVPALRYESLASQRPYALIPLPQAAALAVTATAILVIPVRGARGSRPAQWLAIPGLALGVASLFASLFGQAHHQDVSDLQVLSPPTAVATVLLSAAILAVHPSEGLISPLVASTPTSHRLRRLLPLALAAPLVLAYGLLRLQDLGYTDDPWLVATLATASSAAFVAVLLPAARALNVAHALEARTARDLAIQYAVSQTLMERATPEETMARLLERVGGSLGWRAGAHWERDPHDDVLRARHVWAAGERERPFTQATLETTLAQGAGLPGRAWTYGKALWVPDVREQGDPARAAAANAAGLMGGIAVPIEGASGIASVLEFYSAEPLGPQPALVALVDSLGQQVGQYLHRMRLERQASETLSMLGATLEATQDGILVVDRRRRVATHNAQLRQLWHLEADEVAGASEHTLLARMAALARDPEALRRTTDQAYADPLAESSDVLELGDGRILERHSRPQLVAGRPSGRVWSFRDVTERRRAEAEIRDSQRRFAALFQASPLPLLLARARDGAVLEANHAFVEAFGWPPAQILGRPVGDIGFADPADLARLDDRAAAGPVRNEQLRLKTAAGQQRDALFSVEPLVVGGDAVRVMSVVDITQRVKAEERFRGLLESAPDAVVIVDQTGRIVIANGQAERVFRRPRAEMLGNRIETLVPERFRDRHAKDRDRFNLNPRSRMMGAGLEITALRGDGTEFPVEIRLGPLQTEEGVLVSAAVRDITDRKRNEQLLRDSEERFRELAERIQQVYWVAPADLSKMSYVSPAYRDIFGRDPAALETSAETWFEAIHPDDRARVRDALLPTAAPTGTAVATARGPVDYRIQRPDGETRWIQARAYAVRDQTGAVVRVVGVASDITELKLTEKQLRIAKDAAEQAATAKSQFLASMSHEIRTPMNAVIGMAQLLESTPMTPEQHDFLKTIRTSGEHLLTLINDILDFSKIESGKLELEALPVDVQDVVEEAIELVAPRAAEKRLELLVEAPTGPHRILGDPGRMRQVLLNYLSNAVKFTAKGSVTIGVSGHPQADGRIEVHAWVRDTGIGIPTDRFDRLFQSFSQVDASTTRSFGGTGLGLAISKRLTELMGGRVWCESSPGKGSTFHATFLAPASDHAPKHPAVGSLEGRTAVVVDDQAPNRTILRRMLEGWGMKVEDEEEPRKLLARIAAGERWDVAVIDHMMPDMDGATLAERIRDRLPRGSMPIVMCSSVGQKPEGAVHLDAFVTKPVRPARLREILVSVLDGSKAPTVAAPSATPRAVPIRILLVEDNLVNQKVALHMLQRLGQTATIAGDGKQGMEAARKAEYDLVLMDVQMPVMDGYEATRRIREQAFGAQPRICAMTADAMTGDRERALAAGMDDYMSKPIRLADLERQVTQAAEARARREAAVHARLATPAPAPAPREPHVHIVRRTPEPPAPRPAAPAPQTKPTTPAKHAPAREAKAKERATASAEPRVPDVPGPVATPAKATPAPGPETDAKQAPAAQPPQWRVGPRDHHEEHIDEGVVVRRKTSRIAAPVDLGHGEPEVRTAKGAIHVGSDVELPSTRPAKVPPPAPSLARPEKVVLGSDGASAPATPPPAIDDASFRELRIGFGDDEGLVRELALTYLDESNHLMAELREGLAHQDAKVVQRAAHTLKSTSATFGARALAELSKELEDLARDARLKPVQQKVPRLEELLQAAHADLRKRTGL